MRRFLVVAPVTAAVGSLAAAGVSGAPGAGRLYVEFTFDVRSGPSGENPMGMRRCIRDRSAG